jgi:hypothetical protein
MSHLSAAAPYPVHLDFHGTLRIARWRPVVQWFLAIPHLFVAYALGIVRAALIVVSFVTVLVTGRIPRPGFDVIAMTLRYEWRATTYALFMRQDYPPFDFRPTATDDGADRHTVVTFAYPTLISRWQPLVRWLLAIPQYVVLLGLGLAAAVAVFLGLLTVLSTGKYPLGLRTFLVDVYRYNLRVQAYVGLLSDRYPPFRLQAR